MLTIQLRKEIRNGAARRLTPLEVKNIRDQRTSARPTTGQNWQVERSDDGELSLRYTDKDSGATWALTQQ